MDSTGQQQSPQQENNNPNCFCLLCFSEASSPEEQKEKFIAVLEANGAHRNVSVLIEKYFAEDIPRVEGFICDGCCRQLENFHQFYVQIKQAHWNRKMKTVSVQQQHQHHQLQPPDDKPMHLSERFQMEMCIKEEKVDDGYGFEHSGDVEGLSSFLNEQLQSQADQNGNGLAQNRLLDSIVNEFQASSLGGGPAGCGNDQPFAKRVKRNAADSWQANNHNDQPLGNISNQELEFLDEEFYEYDKPPDDGTQQPPPSDGDSAMDEMERLRRENEMLKRRNHQLVARLREYHVRNTNLLQINRELTDKLRSRNPNALAKPVPSVSDHIARVAAYGSAAPAHVNLNKHPMNATASSSSLSSSPPISAQNVPMLVPHMQQPQPTHENKFISMSGAYTLDNGDVVVMDSVISCRTMMDIDAIESGDKFDLKFVSKLAVALWGHERLAVSSVTGRKSNNSASHSTPSIQLEPEKLTFIKEKVYNRAMMETNDRVQAMARFDDSRINRLLNIKIQNAKRKKNLLNFAIM